MTRCQIASVVVAAVVAVGSFVSPVRAADDVFARDVASILERRCVSCHQGADPKGGLTLTTAKAALAGGDGGPAIVPGKPEESLLLDMLAGDKPDMPKNAPPLSAAEVAALRQWIAAGAHWPSDLVLKDKRFEGQTWWSLAPLVRPAVPKAETSNPIDAFILAKLHEQGLRPLPPADPRTLIRRLTYDLHGLPPTPEEVDDFVRDYSRTPAPPHPRTSSTGVREQGSAGENAYFALVDRLLASPRYGERWGRHWLDVVHYGDTHGYDKDKPRPNAWPYRDYVIRALNEDKPFGRFIEEQLAGDVLFPHTRDGVEGLGFIAAGPWDFIGHAEVPETKIDGKIARLLDRDDMVSSTLNTFCSLTVQCARCHDHKFDPVTQQDYYSLQAVFAAVDRADKTYDFDPAVAKQRAAIEARQRELVKIKDAIHNAAVAKAGQPLVKLDQQIAELTKPKPGQPSKADAYGYHSQISRTQGVSKWVQVDLGKSVALRSIVLHACSDAFAGIGDGFGFPLRFKVELSDDAEFRSGVTAVADHSERDLPNPLLKPISYPVNGQPARYVRITAVKLAPRSNDFIFALSELEVIDVTDKNLALGATVTSLDSIEAPPRWRRGNLADGYYPGANLGGDPDELTALKAEREKLIDAAMDAEARAKFAAASSALADVERELAKLPPVQRVYAGTIHHGAGAFQGTGMTGGKPREIRVLRRGDVRDPLEVVGPGVAPVAADLPSRFDLSADAPEGQRRAALARWIADPKNPLTWRSIVNRVWLYHFGRGLVDSPNDFGRMGQLPSHPELLDWLAVEFRDGGQSLKKLHRLIVTSDAYCRSSALDAANAKFDGGNVYLWRQNRRRLEAEAVRDAVLAVSGKLDLKMGGPGFQDFVIEHPAHSPHYEYKLHNPEDPKAHRRSVYRFIVRSQPQPFMTTLDCADPSMSVEKRNESLTALQALALLNNQLMVTMAKHFSRRLELEADNTSARIDLAYRLALSREPTDDERLALSKYVERFGLANTCRLILNLNEFVFID